MLGWLKKRARGSIQARYISCLLRRDLAQADMFVAEPVQALLSHSLKVGLRRRLEERWVYESRHTKMVKLTKSDGGGAVSFGSTYYFWVTYSDYFIFGIIFFRLPLSHSSLVGIVLTFFCTFMNCLILILSE